MQILNKIFNLSTVYDVTLHVQKSVSENAPNTVLYRFGKIRTNTNAPRATIIYTTLHQTFCHKQSSVIFPHSYVASLTRIHKKDRQTFPLRKPFVFSRFRHKPQKLA